MLHASSSRWDWQIVTVNTISAICQSILFIVLPSVSFIVYLRIILTHKATILINFPKGYSSNLNKIVQIHKAKKGCWHLFYCKKSGLYGRNTKADIPRLRSPTGEPYLDTSTTQSWWFDVEHWLSTQKTWFANPSSVYIQLPSPSDKFILVRFTYIFHIFL